MIYASIAGHAFAVDNKYPRIGYQCRRHAISETSHAIRISVSDDDISREDVSDSAYGESLAVCRKISGRLALDGIVLVHGACVMVDNTAYLFLAPSGTGKTTHIGLWRDMLGDRLEIVCDDKPFIGFQSDIPTAWGGPWSGKEGRTSNLSAPLGGICVLERGSPDRISRIAMEDVFEALLRSSHRPGDPAAGGFAVSALAGMARAVPAFRLECGMDISAARTSYDAMSAGRKGT